MLRNQKQTPMPPACVVAPRASAKNKKRIIKFLLTHEVDMPFSARELAKLPLSILLREKVYVQTDRDNNRMHTIREISAMQFILSQSDNVFTANDLRIMCSEDLLEEEENTRRKMRSSTQRLLFS